MALHRLIITLIICIAYTTIYADDFTTSLKNDLEEMTQFFGLKNNIVSSISTQEKIFNEDATINISMRLKKVSFESNKIYFDFIIQNKEATDMHFFINPDSIVVKNADNIKLKVEGKELSTNINKDLEYFSFIAIEEPNITCSYQIIIPVEFYNINTKGNLIFVLDNLHLK